MDTNVIRFPYIPPSDECLGGMTHDDAGLPDVNPLLVQRSIVALEDAELLCCCGTPASTETLESIARTVLGAVLVGD